MKRNINIICFFIGIYLLYLANHLYGEWRWFIQNYDGISGLLVIVIFIAILGVGFVKPLLTSLYKKMKNNSQ